MDDEKESTKHIPVLVCVGGGKQPNMAMQSCPILQSWLPEEVFGTATLEEEEVSLD